ncbi:hypothetical protein BCR43DRAFT_494830 [Syncephalastrum racemosum]|uniref:Uncharacterized protein n=1 Tax=Syncephalastrum racemosum TaxID=13706 RepID=A0A1X2H8P4_SYNRA|nr:hypothetical protein BCR43DRAFT_494830 [Syncephalastrum racemosum]
MSIENNNAVVVKNNNVLSSKSSTEFSFLKRPSSSNFLCYIFLFTVVLVLAPLTASVTQSSSLFPAAAVGAITASSSEQFELSLNDKTHCVCRESTRVSEQYTACATVLADHATCASYQGSSS